MYDAMKAELLGLDLIPMAEYEWATRPAGNHGSFQLDFPLYDGGDDFHQGEIWEGSIDLFTNGPAPAVYAAIEGILNKYCSGAWTINLNTVDQAVRMLHREYVFDIEGA